MKKTIKDAAIGGGLSLVGSCLGKVTSFSHEMKGSAMVNSGKTKLLTGSMRKLYGQSGSSLIRQGRQLISNGTRYLNTGRGISSVTGSLLLWGVNS